MVGVPAETGDGIASAGAGASEGCEPPNVGADRHCFQRLGVSLLYDTDDIELNIYQEKGETKFQNGLKKVICFELRV